jgi:hypothetical protein
MSGFFSSGGKAAESSGGGDSENPSVEEILSVEKYVSGYACKGNQPTGAVVDLFNDLVNCADESTGATACKYLSKAVFFVTNLSSLLQFSSLYPDKQTF